MPLLLRQVMTPPGTAPDSFVTFAPGSSTILYAGFLREGNNVFQSTDGGATWSVIPGRLKPATKGGYAPRLMPQRMRSLLTVVYFTSHSGMVLDLIPWPG